MLFELVPRGPYSLRASVAFLEGFAPAAYERAEAGPALALAFVADRSEDVAGVAVDERDGVVVGRVFGPADPAVVRSQVERILSLDVDGSGFAAVGPRDPVVGGLQQRYAGLRPVCFWSPYEAAAWTIISRRIRIVQAAAIKARMAEELGAAVDMDGEVLHAFPPPSRLAELEGFPGLFGRKAEWLRALGRAANDGALDADLLRSLPVEEALDRLKALPGIGDFSAELILLRGAGTADVLPSHEARLNQAVQRAYGLAEPPMAAELSEIAERWRPYRTWVSVLLRTMLEDETHEITRGARTRS
jgi:DNA-3-methyladenine glycosylase II